MNDLVAYPEQNNTVANQTPIEIALKMDENGMVSAKHLYEWLQLDPSHYARWCDKTIKNNPLTLENEDYTLFAMQGEKIISGGRPTFDYRISIELAKRIAANSPTKRGALARAYFQKCETALKVSVEQYNMLCSRVEELGALVVKYQEQIDDHNARLALIDGGSKFVTSYQEKWVNDTFEKVKKLAPVYTGGDYKACIGALIDDSRKWLDESYNEYARAYKLKHPEDVNPFRLRVISEFDEFRDAIDNAIYEQMRRFDMVGAPKRSSALDAFYANNVIDAASDF